MPIIYRSGVVPEEDLEFVMCRTAWLLRATDRTRPFDTIDEAPTRFYMALRGSEACIIQAWIAPSSDAYGWDYLTRVEANTSAEDVEAYMRNAARLGLDTGYLYETDDE